MSEEIEAFLAELRRASTPEGRAEIDARVGITHVGGVSWGDAPIPPWAHLCQPQTRGPVRDGFIERCACGAARFDGYGVWIERNQRRRHAGETAPAVRRRWWRRWFR